MRPRWGRGRDNLAVKKASLGVEWSRFGVGKGLVWLEKGARFVGERG